MKKAVKTAVLAALATMLLCGFTKSPQRKGVSADQPGAAAQQPQPPHDSLQLLYLYTDALKRSLIHDDHTEAVRLLLEAAERDSTYAPAWYELAGLSLYSEPDKAVEYARRATQADSSDKWYLQRFGQSLLVARRYGEAIPVFEKLVRTDRNPEDYRILAILYEQNERPFSAIAILDSADGQFGMLPMHSEIKRRLLISTRQYDKALAEAKKAAEAIPYAPENHIALGEIYESRGEDSLARASFRKAVEVDSTSIFAWASLGDYFLRRQDHRSNLEVTQHLFELDAMPLREKREMFRRLTSDRRFYREFYPQINRLAATLSIKYPDDREVIELYTQHLINSGLVEQALAIYKSHLDDEPPVMEYYTMVTAIESYLEHPDSVEYYLDRTLERFPNNPEAYIARAGRYYSDGRTAEALKYFDTALKLADSDSLRSEIWGYIGDLYHSDGNMKRCYSSYERALKYNADNSSVLNNYAYFLSLEGKNLERALKMSGRATELSENNATFLDTHAWVLYCLGRYDEAKRFMRQALSLDSTNSPELRLHYGDILAALGDRYMAEVYWRRALEAGYKEPAEIEARIEKLNNR